MTMNNNYTFQEFKSLLNKSNKGNINWEEAKNFLKEWALDKEKKGDPEYSLHLKEIIKLIEASKTCNKS